MIDPNEEEGQGVSFLPVQYLYFNLRKTFTSYGRKDGPKFVCQGLSYSIHFSIDHHYSPGPQNSEIQSISRPQTSETQPSLLPLQVTGTYLYASNLIST